MIQTSKASAIVDNSKYYNSTSFAGLDNVLGKKNEVTVVIEQAYVDLFTESWEAENPMEYLAFAAY